MMPDNGSHQKPALENATSFEKAHHKKLREGRRPIGNPRKEKLWIVIAIAFRDDN